MTIYLKTVIYSMSKICKRCFRELEDIYFRKHPKTKDGLKYECISCDNKRQKEIYNRNRQKRIKQATEYREENPDKVAEYNQRYYRKSRAKKQA